MPVYTTGEDRGQLYLVMRYIDGVDLAERLRDDPLPPPAVADIVGQIASALDAAHAHGSSIATSSPRTSCSSSATASRRTPS